MIQKIKHFIIGSMAVLVLAGAGSASVAVSAHATNDWWHHDNHHKQDNKPNSLTQILAFVQRNFKELKQGGPLLHEHVGLVIPFLKADLLAEPDQSALTDALDANSQQLADTINTIYPDSHDKFLAMWRQHIMYYTDYLHASKAHDTAGQMLAKQHLNEFDSDLASLLDSISHRLDQDKLKDQLQTHTDGTLMVIDVMVAGNWTKVYSIAHMGYEHMTELTITLLMGGKL